MKEALLLVSDNNSGSYLSHQTIQDQTKLHEKCE